VSFHYFKSVALANTFCNPVIHGFRDFLAYKDPELAMQAVDSAVSLHRDLMVLQNHFGDERH
jgi:hypothetical protein